MGAMTRRKREITGLANEQDFPHGPLDVGWRFTDLRRFRHLARTRPRRVPPLLAQHAIPPLAARFHLPILLRFACHRRRILAVLTGRTLVLLFFISALSRDAVLPAR